MASITFTDGLGAATLTNTAPAPGNRFTNWTPKSTPVGDSAEREADGLRVMLPLRDDFGATFELAHIPMKTVEGVCYVDVADRLIHWLLQGGTCAVYTEDVDSNAYLTCGLMPGTTPQLAQDDNTEFQYKLTLALINVAASPARMICHYPGGT